MFESNSAGLNGSAVQLAIDGTVSATFTDSVFTNNRAQGAGTVRLQSTGTSRFSGCRFERNRTNTNGGAISVTNGVVFVVGCSFVQNAAPNGNGGAVSMVYPAQTFAPLTLEITNCRFVGNTGINGGAAYFDTLDSVGTASFRNCTFSENIASGAGGGLHNTNAIFGGPSSPSLVNCILWQNRDSGGTNAAEQMTTVSGNPTVNYCVFQGGWSGAGGVGIVNANPYFLESPSDGGDGWGDNTATPAIDEGANDDFGDLRPLGESPAIDAGSNAAVPADAADLDGDMITVEPTPYDLVGRPRFANDFCTADTGAGTAPIVDIGAYEYVPGPVTPQPVLYVASDAAGEGDGSSWADAFPSLRDALCSAAGSAGVVEEIWVKEGTYTPSAIGARTTSFQLVDGVAVLGGFDGTEMTAEQRDPVANVTVLSGDLSGNDAPLNPFAPVPPGSWYENSYRVVDGQSVNDCELDGLTVMHALNLGGAYGGLYLYAAANTTVRNCRFVENWGGGTICDTPVRPLTVRIENCEYVRNAQHGGLWLTTSALDNSGAIVIEGCHFEANFGGGLALGRVSAAVRDCVFIGNRADSSTGSGFNGAAITGFSALGSEMRIVGCRFEANIGLDRSGALDLQGNQWKIHNCKFVGNRAASRGGAVTVRPSFSSGNDYEFSNCIFSGNVAGLGGACAHWGSGDVTGARYFNCTFSENVATVAGGAMWNGLQSGFPSSPSIANCIFWSNRDPGGTDESAQIHSDNGAPVVNYSVVQGGWSGAGGVGIIGADPLFRRMPNDGSDGWGDDLSTPTIDESENDDFGDLRPLGESPANDAGDNAAVPTDTADLDGDLNTAEPMPLDLAGNPRFAANPCAADAGAGTPPLVDMGAYEFPEFPLAPGQTVMYVNAAAVGAENGSSWADAFTNLQTALCAAAATGGAVQELWIAAGEYKPAPPGGARSASFQLVNGLALYGGFAGTETSRNQRDLAANETILSGDLNGDDNPSQFPNGATFADNCYHVVNITSNDNTAILDGLILSGGNANGASPPDDRGGGLLDIPVSSTPGTPIVRHCTFALNSATFAGGAVYSNDNPASGGKVFDGCQFVNNRAPLGAALWATNATPGAVLVLADCDFVSNVGTTTGAINFIGLHARFVNCRFASNTANSGAAINAPGSPSSAVTLMNCSFLRNAAGSGNGGALRLVNAAQWTLVGCRFVGNSAANGGAIYTGTPATGKLVNCTLIANRADTSGGGVFGNGFAEVNNSIFWGNQDIGGSDESAQIHATTSIPPSPPTLMHTLIQGGWSGPGGNNISADPLFIRNADPGADGEWDGFDDDFGDLRPAAASPVIDAGNNALVSADAPDLDCDSDVIERTPFDLNGTPRFLDDTAVADCRWSGDPLDCGPPPVVDMGAYERGALIGDRLFVDASATGQNDGSSWTDAFTNPATALGYAATVGCTAREVWIARGTYMPDGGRQAPAGAFVPGSGDREATFQLADGVVLYGGFAGGESSLSQRDPTLNVTTLSGDLALDDGSLGFSDNSYHVLTGTGTGAVAIVDGVTISGGNASGGRTGGGLITQAGGPTLRNCILANNRGDCAAAIDVQGGELTVANLTIQPDVSVGGGSNVSLTQSTFNVDGVWSIPDGVISAFGAVLSGDGALTLGPTSLLHVRPVSACGDAIVALDGSGSLAPTPIVLPATTVEPLLPARWEISAGQLSDASLGRDGLPYRLQIAPSPGPAATLTWSGNVVEQDLSAGGRAEARFSGGGTLEITGALHDTRVPGSPIYTGLLLRATVEGFHVRETTATSNALEFVVRPRLTPTGGYLVENDRDFVLAGRQWLHPDEPLLVVDGATGFVDVFTNQSLITLHTSCRVRCLEVNGVLTNAEVDADVRGTGDIHIDAGSSLVLTGDAVLNLSGLPDDVCVTTEVPGAPPSGTVSILGKLIVRDSARVHNTEVDVTGAVIEDTAVIEHNDIRLLESAPGFGGEFIAGGNSTITCNVIRSVGDRYLDLDPDPDDGQQPTLLNNLIYVTINQGTGTDRGELLELRSQDVDHALNGGFSGAHLLASSSGYSGGVNPWVLEQIEVLSNAKVNLTNRPGFVFTPGSPYPEALYVKELMLHPGAVLNTALQRLYYQSLVDENGVPLVPDPGPPGSFNGGTRHLEDIPLLGFSLKVIEMEDDTEFAVRVVPRLRDPADVQPAPPAAPLAGQIVRLEGTQPTAPENGTMRMSTQAPDADPAASIAAHGAFARAGEDKILVEFEYLFQQLATPPADTELVVYLSDSPDARDANDLDDDDDGVADHAEIARIRPPQSGLAGSVGSGRFAIFRGEFPRGNLNFTRGTYVEIELRGRAACVDIDRFDPQIRCTGNQCGDVTGNNAVAANDYLGYVAWYGRAVGVDSGGQGSTGCLDPSPTSDNYIDINDLLAADARLVSPPPADLCTGYGGGTPQNGTPVGLPADMFVLLGKSGASSTQQPDLLYALTTGGAAGSFPGATESAPVTPPSLPRLGTQHRADVRLIQDAGGPGGRAPDGGNVYLLHLTQGLYRVDTGALVLAPGSASFGADVVHVGVRTYFVGDDPTASPPILDVAFDPADASIVYVAPVLVQVNGVGSGYRAAARLALNGDGTFALQQLYGSDPAADPCVNSAPPDTAVCDVRSIREVELDEHGNLFVLSAREDNDNDWLLIYETASGFERRIQLTTLNATLLAPMAMRLTADGSELYVASAINDAAASAVAVERFSITRSGSVATGLAVAGTTQIDGMRHVMSLVEAPGATPAQRRIWAFGFTGPTFTELPFIPDTTPPLADYATPTRADFAPGAATATATTISGHASNALALPLSAVYRPPTGPALVRGDVNCDSSIDFFDIDPFLLALFNPAGYATEHPTCDITSADCNQDASVDFFDIDPFLVCLFSGCP